MNLSARSVYRAVSDARSAVCSMTSVLCINTRGFMSLLYGMPKYSSNPRLVGRNCGGRPRCHFPMHIVLYPRAFSTSEGCLIQVHTACVSCKQYTRDADSRGIAAGEQG